MKRSICLAAIIAVVFLASVIIYLVITKCNGDENSASSKVPVVFRIYAPDAKSVFVTGSFNSWKTIEFLLEKKSDGNWETAIPIAPGRYEYKFIVDSTWMHDPKNPIKVPVTLPFVGYNSVLEVKSNNKDTLKIDR
jgi:Glycogen recognition site of AMP-activated protein kinase